MMVAHDMPYLRCGSHIKAIHFLNEKDRREADGLNLARF